MTYDLWEGYNSGAGYYVFSIVPRNTVGVVTTLPTSGSANINLRAFFDASRTGSRYKKSMYLDVVEAGFEITRGNGWGRVQGSFAAY